MRVRWFDRLYFGTADGCVRHAQRCAIRTRSLSAARICGHGNSVQSRVISPSRSTASSLPATPASEVAGVLDSLSRALLGWCQEDLARNAAVSEPTIARLEASV